MIGTHPSKMAKYPTCPANSLAVDACAAVPPVFAAEADPVDTGAVPTGDPEPETAVDPAADVESNADDADADVDP